MLHDERIDELIEVILETGRTPEEVCADAPELLTEVRTRVRKLKVVQAQVDSLFPPSEAATHAYDAAPDVEVVLPTIPDHEVQSVLGRGGMGIVYKARHAKLHREVALKMLLTGPYASRQEHLRFVREAESVAALKHPHIVQIYEFGEVGGRPYFTMEYLDSGTLAERLGGAVQSPRDAAKLVAALAHAVQAAHQAGIVHRDLKPGNVLLADDGTPKISDFGLARRLDQDSSLTNTGARIGTPSYMAPEQLTGQTTALGPAVDIFALGAILYEMLTGRPPFRGTSLSDTERKLATEEAAPPSRFNPKAPRDLETICLKCLEKDPAARYATAGDLADDLERFLRHEPIQARPVAPAERWMRWVRRNPLLTALAVTSIVLLALIANDAMQEWALASASRSEKARLTARLESGIQLVQAGRFAEARALLGKLGDGGFEDLRRRIDRVLSDLGLAEKLDAIGVERAVALNAGDSTWRPDEQAAAAYAGQFSQAAIGKPTDDPAVAARRIVASDIEAPLIAALDDWAVCEADEARRGWILEVARQAANGPGSWSNQCRDGAVWTDREALARLAETVPLAEPSVQQLRALGDRLNAAGHDAIAFRRRVEQQHVDSFLANLTLADAMRETEPAEAIRYYQAALAIRPQSAVAHNNLAVALTRLGRAEEALVEYLRARELDADSAAICFNLGLALTADRPDDAIEQLKQAAQLDAKMVAPHRALGELYFQRERFAEAEASLRACLALLQDEAERDEVAELLRQCEARQKNP